MAFRRAVFDDPLSRAAESYGSRHVLRSRPHAALVAPAIENRLKLDPFAHIEGAHALRRIELVAADRIEIGTQRLDVDIHFARSLHAIGMKCDARFLRNTSNFLYWLNGSQLIVGMHDADQPGVGTDRAPNGIRVDHAAQIDRNRSEGIRMRAGGKN